MEILGDTVGGVEAVMDGPDEFSVAWWDGFHVGRSGGNGEPDPSLAPEEAAIWLRGQDAGFDARRAEEWETLNWMAESGRRTDPDPWNEARPSSVGHPSWEFAPPERACA